MNIFQQITDYVKRDHTTFNMSNNWLGSINGFGSLNNIYQKIVIAGDTWKCSHNAMVKLPPLISPAFTRIKGVINTYFCSFASVWNYWNSFISDKPEDVFLSRSLTQSYKGKFVEPCCRMSLIATICKIARGYFSAVSSQHPFNWSVQNNILYIELATLYTVDPSTLPATPTSLVWGFNVDGRRKCTWSSNVGSVNTTGDKFYFDGPYNQGGQLMTIQLAFKDFGGNSNDTPYSLGFSDFPSYFIHCCQEVERNLSNHGVPTDLIAQTHISHYASDYFNLLPAMCDSSIWHNFYRDEQNQSPEFDYREVNGCICNPQYFGGNMDTNMTFGWHLRLLGIPPSVSSGSDYWFTVDNQNKAFAVLTGFMLESSLRDTLLQRASATDILILPKFYNGLLTLKYRNFEKDYFTSASVDPNFGGISVQVPSTIDALRTASKLEEFLEVSASARDFYNFMKTIFGTNPESTRYQKPLLLGTQVIPVQISEQLQTSETANTPLGQRAGVADGYGNSGTANHFFNEHGIVTSFLSFVLDSQYMQGMPHEFWHHLQLDYPFPQFANLGAESIPLKEIYYSDGAAATGVDYLTGDNNAVVDNYSFELSRIDSNAVYNTPSGVNVGLGVHYSPDAQVEDISYYDTVSTPPNVFGYTPRYSRWKYANDVVAGQMRDSLEFWHTFRHFSAVPYISNNFVSYMNAGYLSNLNRIFADENDNSDKFVVDIFNNCSVRRCLPLVPQTTVD